jgi:hypothetical protein
MSAYLLPCVCGKTVPVDVGQAGGQVQCSCGTRLDVPTLRQLRHLQRAPTEDVQHAAAWGQRQGIVAASLIIALLLLGWSAWVWHNEPQQPKFDPATRRQAVEEQLKTPLGAWESWIGYYRPLAERGLPVFHVANAAQIESKRADARFLRYMLWAIAAVFAIVAGSAAFWPAPVAHAQRR